VVFFLIFIPLILITTGSLLAADALQIAIDFSGQTNGEGVPAPWDLSVKKGKPFLNIISENGDRLLHLKSTKSSFALEREVAVDVHQYPNLTWTWKALSIPLNGDIRKKDANDQALQLILAFKGDRVLSYIWDSNAPDGTVVDEKLFWPMNLKIKVMVVMSGASDLGKWFTITRNVFEDYRNLFNETPSPLVGVRIQMNTQHTGGNAEGLFKGIFFSRKIL